MNQIIISGKVVELIDHQHEDDSAISLKIKNIEIFGSTPKISTITVSARGSLQTFVESELSIGDDVLVVGRYKTYTKPFGGAISYRSMVIASSITKEEFKQYE